MDFLTYDIYVNMEIIFLVTLRIIAFIVSAPFFSGQYINNYIKVGLSFILANVVVATGMVGVIEYSGVLDYFIIGIKEVIIGLILGFTATIIANVVIMLGDIIDFQMGFTMASVMDPLSGVQMPITGNMYFFIFIAILLITNIYHEFIKAIIYSYNVLGIGMFEMTQRLFDTQVEIIRDMFVTALKLASPIIAIMLLINIALGILARTVPQLNMFVVGFPIKIYVSLYILVLITPVLIMSFSYIFDKINVSIMNILKGMIP